MTNIEILKEAFTNCGYYTYFENNPDGSLDVMVELRGDICVIYFSATYDADVDLDNVIPLLEADMNYTNNVRGEESKYVKFMMEKYVTDVENTGIYACETIINSWNIEKAKINHAWENFTHKLDRALDEARLEANRHDSEKPTMK